MPTARNAIPASAYPLELAAAHRRIAALWRALELADARLADATPYVNGVSLDYSNAPWRRETAALILAGIREARACIAAELQA